MRTTNEIREKIVKMYLEGYSIRTIVAEVSCTSRTIYKVLDAAGVKGAERQEREADVINVTITDAAVVRWLRSQPNAAEAIAKLVYSQIDRTPDQNPRIADSMPFSEDGITIVNFTFYNKEIPIGDHAVCFPAGCPEDIMYSIIQEARCSYFPDATSAKNNGNTIHFD